MKSFWLALLTCLPLTLQASDNDISKVNGSVRVSAGQPAGDVSTVNGSIHIEDGVTAENIETVNGSIHVGRNAVVDTVDTVNGGVSLGEGAQASAVETVNGTLKLDASVRINGDVSAVNGSMWLAKGTQVAGKLENVNGKMTLEGAHVGGGLETVNGDINVGANSRVEGGILVEKPGFSLFSWGKRKPKIVIGPGAVVQGELKFEHAVELYVSDSAKIGPVEGATPIAFSGAEPRRSERRETEKVERESSDR